MGMYHMSVQTLIKNVLLEDFVHWWCFFAVLQKMQLSFWHQLIIQSLLFALGHLGPGYKQMMRDKAFWLIKFPVMCIFGALFFWIAFSCSKVVVTIVHVSYDVLVLYLYQKSSTKKTLQEHFETLNKYYQEHPPAPSTPEEIQKLENWKKELAMLNLDIMPHKIETSPSTPKTAN